MHNMQYYYSDRRKPDLVELTNSFLLWQIDLKHMYRAVFGIFPMNKKITFWN